MIRMADARPQGDRSPRQPRGGLSCRNLRTLPGRHKDQKEINTNRSSLRMGVEIPHHLSHIEADTQNTIRCFAYGMSVVS